MEHWRAFGPEWFERHQSLLLWLLRAPLLGRWFRWCLRIRSCDIGYAREILDIKPHCYTVAGDEPDTLVTDFRTHWKYSKRLYYAFRPLWWAMHCWDALIAEPFIPRWSFGFPTLERYPDADPETSTVDGAVSRFVDPGEAWSTLRAGAGNSQNSTQAEHYFCDGRTAAVTDEWVEIIRSVLLFDVSSIIDNQVQAGTLSIYVTMKNEASLTPQPTIAPYQSAPASNTSLTGSDYGTFGSVELSSPVIYSSLTNDVYNAFVLNASGLSLIVNIAKLGFRNANYDVADTAPAWAAFREFYVQGRFADQGGVSNDPKLEVTHVLKNKILAPNHLRAAIFSPGIAR